jgi:3' exoribonuclease, RNase T-like
MGALFYGANMKHVMVDLETLGTSADAVIMSIGAVRFDLETAEIDDLGFYASVSVDSNLALKRRVSEDTLLWWLKQSPDAQKVFHEPKIELSEALSDLSDWLGTDGNFMWSNGADFDLPMVAHAYTQAQIEVPWKFWNSRCVRTYKNLPGAKDVKFATEGVKHNALSDAVNQARQVQAIHAALFSKTTAQQKPLQKKTTK